MTRNHPDFVVIGAMKSASTSLADFLSEHPAIYVSPVKEPGFFSRDERYQKGINTYLRLYDAAEPGQLTAEASTCYSRLIAYPHAAERLHLHAPNCKLIYIMRNPVRRTYSHYAFSMAERISGKHPEPIIPYSKALTTIPEILDASDYIKQIRHYLEFFPAEQLHLIILEDMLSNEENEIRRLSHFLGIEPLPVNQWCMSHSNSKGTNVAKRQSKQLTENLTGKVPESLKRCISEKTRRHFRSFLQQNIAFFIKKSAEKTVSQVIPEASYTENQWVYTQLKDSITELEAYLERPISPWNKHNRQFDQ